MPRGSKIKHIFKDHEGNVLHKIPKFDRDVIAHTIGVEQIDEKKVQTVFNPINPLADGHLLKPGPQNPICRKCNLDTQGAQHPYMEPHGSEDPLITVVFDSVSAKEDISGQLASEGPSSFLKKIIREIAQRVGVDMDRIRWAPVTRCAARTGKLPNYRTKGNWCRNFLVQDLKLHPPKLIIPVGTAVLGLLSFKSNAQDWGGKLLTYRGWPDDWLTEPDYNFPRPYPVKDNDGSKLLCGHPFWGQPIDLRIPMAPIQAPRLIFSTQNANVIKRWKGQIEKAIVAARDGVPPQNFDRPWFRLTENPQEVIDAMTEIRSRPGQLVCYDTETTGLKPWGVGQSIVFMMFRWDDEHGNPRSIGFPWDYDGSSLRPYIKELAPHILEAMYASKLIGHNLTFDILFTVANVPGCDLNKLCPQAVFDTWHMAYTARQQTGSLGLDLIAYDWVPDMAGYEEDMTLLIDLHSDTMNPSAGKGGHYANCPKDKWDSHLKIYVMGDVEVAKVAHQKIYQKLQECRTYTIPLAHPDQRGRFRRFTPPSRLWVYDNVMSPASRMLQKMMARGMFVDVEELAQQEDMFPKKIRETKEKIRRDSPVVAAWVERKENEARDKGEFWEFDPENKEQLKDLLFQQLQLPVQRLTSSGKKIYGESDLSRVPADELLKYAALDKYTLNKLAVDHVEVRPLQEYRKIFKQYTTYIRPMRNLRTIGIDKKARTEYPHLARDGCVHASFKLTGTRGGRLSCVDPNLQQLPRDGVIKRIYTSRFGERGCVYQADLSQIELRLLAAACGDESMVNAYWNGIDLHALTHSLIYRKDYDKCTNEYMEWLQGQGRGAEAKVLKEERKVAKTVNFLTGYGGGAFGLQTSLAQQGLYFTLEKCEEILERFFDSYPALRTYLGYYKKFIQDSGVAVSILGRVRIFEEIFSDDNEAKNKALRAGCNHLIQSTASDMMLIMLNTIENLMRAENLESMLVTTVHDSLTIDAVRSELPILHEIVFSVLNNMPDVMKLTFGPDFDTSWMIVPFAGDCEVGHNYLDARKIPMRIDNIDWDKLLADDEDEK